MKILLSTKFGIICKYLYFYKLKININKKIKLWNIDS